ncbi:DUF1566 domain-containing protein [Vibrio vulnificus]|uniref:Lcl C-terminal domain-containing protein n=1 Tax=Vibrio vulnificus TaxID=672 RepID=UPI002413CE8A|nr:DUF1566 domain-containing protein [Vibrio vulnificus]
MYDKETNLTWMRCSIGQTWDGKTCTGRSTRLEWYEAQQLKFEFAGSNTWRLPTADELGSLVFCSQGYDPQGNGCQVRNDQRPTIDIRAFPNTLDSFYWSSSPVANSGYSASGVSFYSGLVIDQLKGLDGHVRMVRAGQ